MVTAQLYVHCRLPQGLSHAYDTHATGADKEARQWPAFLELGALLPRMHLHLIFVGPRVPRALDGRSALFAAPHAAVCGRPGCSCSNAPGALCARKVCCRTAGVSG